MEGILHNIRLTAIIVKILFSFSDSSLFSNLGILYFVCSFKIFSRLSSSDAYPRSDNHLKRKQFAKKKKKTILKS